jgi:hypothetical protein
MVPRGSLELPTTPFRKGCSIPLSYRGHLSSLTSPREEPSLER